MDFNATPPSREFEIRSVTALLRRQIRVILYAVAVIFGLAFLFLLLVNETYTATALVLVDPDQKSILNPSASLPTSAGRENARVDSEVEILRSDAVALAVIKRRNLVGDTEFGARLPLREKLARAVGIANAAAADQQRVISKTLGRFKDATNIRRRGLTYLIAVSAASQSPRKAADLANATAQAYIDQQVQAKVSASLAARDVLQGQIEEARRALSSYETDFDSLVLQNAGLGDSADGPGSIGDLRAKLLGAALDLKDKENQRQAAMMLTQQEDWSALAQTLNDGALVDLEAKRRALLAQIPDTRNPATATDFKQALARLDAELSRQSAARVLDLSTGIRALDQTVSGLRGQLRRSVLSSDLSPEMLTGIYALQQETTIARAQYQSLLSRMRDLDTQARIQIANSRVVSPAIAPVSPSFPNRNLVLLAALAASMGLGVSLAFLNEYYIGGVTSATQLGELLQTPTAATIPVSIEQNAGRLSVAEKVIDAPLSVYSESIRKLRATIDQTFRSALPGVAQPAMTRGKIILVTSSLPDEGKTTTALALARTYALSGRKTLLIDADLRKPSLHRHLGYEPQSGFRDYLQDSSNSNPVGSFYARDPASPLALILGAVRSEFATDQLLSSATFEMLLDQARDVYDVVIIDTPPLLPVVDARYVAHYADAVVMMVKWAATSQSDLRAAITPLSSAMKPGAALLPVLGQVPERVSRTEYGGYGTGYSTTI
jgi:polysaccharide biosynthesis transport protein